MALPKPRPGLVIGYDFLFREQADVQIENANKPHPAAVILVVRQGAQERVRVVATSHVPPSPAEAAFRLKLTSAECREMGLDTRDQWINLRDINAFDWPGYDLVRSAPGNSYVYGAMSKGTFARVVSALQSCAGRRFIKRD
jgi:hypothetical protein